MSREKLKAMLPVIQAYAEGQDIQIMQIDDETNEKVWLDINPWRFDVYETYRIKPQVTYRPFKDAEECWSEMQKHQPFGWVKNQEGEYIHIVHITDVGVCEGDDFEGFPYGPAAKVYNFADGTPFGIKEGGEQ